MNKKVKCHVGISKTSNKKIWLLSMVLGIGLLCSPTTGTKGMITADADGIGMDTILGINGEINSLPIRYVIDLNSITHNNSRKSIKEYESKNVNKYIYNEAIKYSKSYELSDEQAIKYVNEIHNYYLMIGFLYSKESPNIIFDEVLKGALVEKYYKGKVNKDKVNFIEGYNDLLELTYKNGIKYKVDKTPKIDNKVKEIDKSLSILNITTKYRR